MGLYSTVPIRGMTMALAVETSTVRQTKNARRDPTPDDRSHTERLAKMILSNKGVKPSDAARLSVDQLTIIEFILGIPEIVASVAVE